MPSLLFQQNHLSCLHEIFSLHAVEVYTARYLSFHLISAVPKYGVVGCHDRSSRRGFLPLPRGFVGARMSLKRRRPMQSRIRLLLIVLAAVLSGFLIGFSLGAIPTDPQPDYWFSTYKGGLIMRAYDKRTGCVWRPRHGQWVRVVGPIPRDAE